MDPMLPQRSKTIGKGKNHCGGPDEEARGQADSILTASVGTGTSNDQDKSIAYFEQQTGNYWTWPVDKTPLKMVGCFHKDRTLCYVIQYATEPPTDQPSIDNILIVRGTGFRKMHPRLVIAYYEDSVRWFAPTESREQLQEKASNEIKRVQDFLAPDPNFDVNNNDLDEDGLPLPPEKRAGYKNPNATIDKSGLPTTFDMSDSSDNDEFEEIEEFSIPQSKSEEAANRSGSSD